MPAASLPANERLRLQALRSCEILDTARDSDFDALTSLAAQLCDVPIALVSLIDEERQWFKSSIGRCVTETPRAIAFCSHTILAHEPLIIHDATQDPCTRDNPLVTGDPHIRFYAGVPLRTAEGFALGTLCVIDTKTRDLTDEQIHILKNLARQVVALLELRRQTRQRDRMESAIRGTRFGIGPVAAAVLLAGLAVTAWAVYRSNRASMAVASQRFSRLNERVLDDITRRINVPTYGMKGARGVYAATTEVRRKNFEAYVASRDLPHEFPGILGFGFVQHVMRKDLDAFVTAERADGVPNFAIHDMPNPTAPRQDLYIIKYLYPTRENQRVWGLDLGSEPARRAAAELAIRSAQPTITASLTLVQDSQHRRGILYYVPVYKNGVTPITEQQRMDSAIGLVYAPIVISEVLANTFDAGDGMLNVTVSDDMGSNPDDEIFDTRDGPGKNSATHHSALEKTSTLNLGGRVWFVHTATTTKFDSAIEKSALWTGIGGSLLTLLLATVVWSIGRSRARAFALANSMTADLHEAKDRAERTSRELHAQSHSLQIQSDRLEAAAEILRRTGEMAHVGGWEVDVATNRVTWADELYRIHELPVGTEITVDVGIAFYPPGAREQIEAAVRAAMLEGKTWDLELPLVTAKGKQIFVRAQGESIWRDDKVVKLRGVFQDITERKNTEEQLRRSATHDKLTGLPNRTLLNDRLQQCLNRYTRHPDRPFALLFLDFDRFKMTNDTLGHDAGDDLLKQIAGRLRRCLRPTDSVAVKGEDLSTISRLGGDEFVIILDEVRTADDVATVANRLLATLAAPYSILGHEVVSTASIGIVTSKPEYTRAEEMLRDADIAMYEAKFAGKGRYVLFDTQMHERINRRMQTEGELRKAITNGQLILAYQPILSLGSGNTHGIQTLLRWNHPERGLLLPADFLSVAEESGLILPITERVLRSACEQFKKWQTTLGDAAPASISMDLPYKQLVARGFAQQLKACLDEYQMDPSTLHLQVAEKVAMKDPAFITGVLEQIHNVGVRIDLSGFGTGQSSLTMLHQLPLTGLKIDRTLVRNLTLGREFVAIVQAVAELSRNLGIDTIAEGVDSADQLALLQTLGCDFGQGNFLGGPQAPEAFEEKLAANACAWNQADSSAPTAFASRLSA